MRSLYQTAMKELDFTVADVFTSVLFVRYYFNHIQDRGLDIQIINITIFGQNRCKLNL